MRGHHGEVGWRIGQDGWTKADGQVLAATLSEDVGVTVGGDEAVTTKAPSRVRGGAVLDWEGWVADLDARGRGWSSTENRLAPLVAAMVTPGRQVPVVGFLDSLAARETDVWRILTTWASGGNNRDMPGKLTVVERHRIS